eukprot:m.68440 g.68440  ORF g.68440 m.68440 type:complete len:60 (+) comp23951_c0_seq2:109-288(+)
MYVYICMCVYVCIYTPSGDSVVIPAGDPFVFTSTNPHTRVLEINLPAQIVTTTKGKSRL